MRVLKLQTLITSVFYSLPKTVEFSFVLSNAVVETVRVEINAIPFIFFEVDHSKLESLRDVSVTRIGDTLSYGFPQTVLEPLSLTLNVTAL